MIRVVFWHRVTPPGGGPQTSSEVFDSWLPAVPRVGEHLELPEHDGKVVSVSWVIVEHPESSASSVTVHVTFEAG